MTGRQDGSLETACALHLPRQGPGWDSDGNDNNSRQTLVVVEDLLQQYDLIGGNVPLTKTGR